MTGERPEKAPDGMDEDTRQYLIIVPYFGRPNTCQDEWPFLASERPGYATGRGGSTLIPARCVMPEPIDSGGGYSGLFWRGRCAVAGSLFLDCPSPYTLPLGNTVARNNLDILPEFPVELTVTSIKE